MIFFHFSIQNPFKPKAKASKTYLLFDTDLSKNKNLQVEFTKMSQCLDILDITLDLRWYGIDHAGPRFDLSIGRFMFSINLYDARHWDDRKHTWHEQ